MTTAKIADSNVTTAKIADSNVTTAKINDAAVTPAKRSGGFYAGTFTNSGTGNKSITGVGFTPKLVTFNTGISSSTTSSTNAIGWMTSDGTQFAQWASANSSANTSARNVYTTRCLAIGASASVTATEDAHFVSMDADGFTISVDTNNNQTWAFIAWG